MTINPSWKLIAFLSLVVMLILGLVYLGEGGLAGKVIDWLSGVVK